MNKQEAPFFLAITHKRAVDDNIWYIKDVYSGKIRSANSSALLQKMLVLNTQLCIVILYVKHRYHER